MAGQSATVNNGFATPSSRAKISRSFPGFVVATTRRGSRTVTQASGDCGPATWQRRLDGRGLVDAHIRPVASREQELGVDQGAQEQVAGCLVEIPQAPSLRSRQPKPRHFEKLALHPAKHVVYFTDHLYRHIDLHARVASWVMGGPVQQQPKCHSRASTEDVPMRSSVVKVGEKTALAFRLDRMPSPHCDGKASSV